MARSRKSNGDIGNGSLEAKLWQTADALRNNMDAAEYKHVVLGLIFLKYISDAFEARHADLETQRRQGADAEDPDEYRAANIFWVPKEARWQYLKANAPQPTIGKLVYCPANNWTMNPDSPMLKGCRDRYPHWTSKKQMHGNCDSGYRPSVRRSKWR